MSLALLTDLYQLTMAYGYWKSGRSDDAAVFHLFFRENPFGGGYTIAAGLGTAIEFLDGFRFADDDIEYLRGLCGNDRQRLLPDDFLGWLSELNFACDVDAIEEGTVVFPNEPLVRVTGPIAQAQIIESALLNFINFQSLIATKASRVVQAAQGDPVLDFGLRRAQGIDGSLSASRAAYIGGCAATSNVLAAKRFGIPTRGTHAHSWVMAFESEDVAFETYASVMPNNALLLVDTYDTLEGVRNAIRCGLNLRERGHELAGIRLDSGELGPLSIEARRLLDEAGFEKAVIAASNDLDEYLIAKLKAEGARINVWGVGTRLVTAYDQPALGGVYKLSALRRAGGEWDHKIKLSEQNAKTSTPGVLQVRRFESEGRAVEDLLYDQSSSDGPKRADATHVDLLAPIYRAGRRVYEPPPLADVRARRAAQLARFGDGILRLAEPDRYPVGLEEKLFERRERMIREARALINRGR